MSIKRCPTEAELLSFVDGDLAPEPLQRVEHHLTQCAECLAQAHVLLQLIRDIQAPVAHELDVATHVRTVMARLDTKVPRSFNLQRGYLGAIAAAAGVFALLTWTPEQHPSPGHFAARGADTEASLARDVGVQLYVSEDTLLPLLPGGSVRRSAALTAGLRNLSSGQAHLLLFGIDARHVVHWIAPEFTTPDTDPRSFSVEPSLDEQLLPSSVVFDDLAPGPLRIVALITAAPMHVSDIERLTTRKLDGDLLAQFPLAVARQITIEVSP